MAAQIARRSLALAVVLCVPVVAASSRVSAQEPPPSPPHVAPASIKTIRVYASGTVRTLGEGTECRSQPCEDPSAPKILPLHRGRLVRVVANFAASRLSVSVEGRAGLTLRPTVRRRRNGWRFAVPARSKSGFSQLKLVFTHDRRIDSVWLVPVTINGR